MPAVTSLQRWLGILGGVALVTSALPACGGDDGSGVASNNVGGSGQSGGSGGSLATGGTSSGGTTATCPTACSSGEVCSVTGSCIPSGTCKADGDCTQGGLVCDVTTGQCVPGGGCAQKPFQVSAQPPNVLIVLDRSGSMGKDVPNAGGKTRWQVAAEAINQVLTKYGSKINFGLSLFSACKSGGCSPGVIDDPIPSSITQINATIASTQLCNSGDPETVIGGTLQGLVGASSLQQPGRDNVVLLITDGADNCGGGGAAAAKALLGQAVPVKTFVVGFSGDVNSAELTAIATAAGTAPYYQADSATQLNTALDGIVSGVATCTYQLDQAPPGSSLWVFFNKDPNGVPSDPNNGWTYDATTNSLTFNGTSCDDIKQGKVTDIQVIYSCSKPTPA